MTPLYRPFQCGCVFSYRSSKVKDDHKLIVPQGESTFTPSTNDASRRLGYIQSPPPPPLPNSSSTSSSTSSSYSFQCMSQFTLSTVSTKHLSAPTSIDEHFQFLEVNIASHATTHGSTLMIVSSTFTTVTLSSACAMTLTHQSVYQLVCR